MSNVLFIVYRQVFDELVRFVRASYMETDDERIARMNKVCLTGT